MKIVLLLAVCVVGMSAVPSQKDLLSVLRSVLDKKQVTDPPIEVVPTGRTGPPEDLFDDLPMFGIFHMTMMDMFEEACEENRPNRRPTTPPPSTEAPEDNPTRQLLYALKRVLDDGEQRPHQPHPRRKALQRAFNNMCRIWMEAIDREGPEPTETPESAEPTTTELPLP